MSKDKALVFLASEEERVADRILSDIRWMRSTLDRIEKSVQAKETAGGSSSVTTESLFQAVGEWDGIQRAKKILRDS